MRVLGLRALGHFLGRKLFPRPEQEQLKRTFIERWADNDRQAYLYSLAAVAGWNIMDRLESITCPTSVISGEHDFIPLALKQNYVRKLPAATLVVIPESMHFTPVDHPNRFNEELMGFLGKQKVSATGGIFSYG